MNEEFLNLLLTMPEYERKQVAMFLIGSTLNPMPQEEVANFLKKLDKK